MTNDNVWLRYADRRVLVTGHTGFKGTWLTVCLHALGAQVHGFALAPNTTPALFDAIGAAQLCSGHTLGDVRDLDALSRAVADADPDVIFHLAAQPLVRLSYREPLETIATNVLGTANLLEVVRRRARPCIVVVVTSDKCYENRETVHAYREDDPMGGHDPYSMSKAAAELVVSSYRRSFFAPERLAQHGVALASTRAGNVIGGGDWSSDRLLVDAIRALSERKPILVRNPQAVRPWQHVLEPLGAYLLLGARLMDDRSGQFCRAWNFGPRADENHTVRDLIEALIPAWGEGSWQDASTSDQPHEAGLLRLAIDQAVVRLGWAPRWCFAETLRRTADWYRAYYEGARGEALLGLMRAQIDDYIRSGEGRG